MGAERPAPREGWGETIAREIEWMERYGWYTHYVTDDESSPLGANAHTHGLPESFSHPDLQVVVPIPPDTMQALFGAVIERIRAGARFEPGQIVADFLADDLPISFALAEESGREVLRIVVCDSHGRLDPAEMDEPWGAQWDGCLA